MSSENPNNGDGCCFEEQFDQELEAIEQARDHMAGQLGSDGGDLYPDSKTQEKPASAFDRAHRDSLLGLTFSGGGIRSATFNLGILQGLAGLRLLRRVDYLSTVSGGGYIGSWLSAWVHREKDDKGILGVEKKLAPTDGSQPEPDQVRRLRGLSNYLTPRVGALSTDTLTGVATYLRNLLLNQILLLLAGSAVLILPWALVAGIPALSNDWVRGLLLLAAILLFIGSGLAGYETRRASFGTKAPSGDANGERADTGSRRPYWLQLSLFALAAAFSGALITYKPEQFEQLAWWQFSAAGCVTYGLGMLVGWFWAVLSLKVQGSKLSNTIWSASTLFAAAGLGAMLALWAHLVPDLNTRSANPLTAVAVGPLVVLGIFLLTVTLHLGLAGRGLREAGRELWSRHGAHQLRLGIGWLFVTGAALFGPFVVLWLYDWVAALGLTWVITTLAGVIAGSSSTTGAKGGSRLAELAARVAPFVFVVGLLLLVSYGVYRAIWQWSPPSIDTTVPTPHAWICGQPDATQGHPVYDLDLDIVQIESNRSTAKGTISDASNSSQCSFTTYVEASANLVREHGWAMLLVYAVVLFGAALGLSWRVDVNVFSFHMFYRNRIERCYMGASNPRRRPHPRTGLDPQDAPELRRLTLKNAGNPPGGQRPFPIINTALNITRADNLAWQERKAASFTFTPMYCGYDIRDPDGQDLHCYQPTGEYVEKDRGWLSLGVPITISGAAASPNAGYHTSAATAFLMTVFNVRLGWWLQNPRSSEYWQKAGPKRSTLFLLLQELAGMTNDRSRYVYLSDGGHFENLGLYELVRRRCRYIIACDAGCDPEYGFEDLGNAIRKCKIDFGIDIDIEPRVIKPDPESGLSAVHCAVGRIRYDAIKDERGQPGFLLYLKASITGDEPADVLQYRNANEDFPHQTTADQWYSESQFESYRKLGAHVLKQVFDGLVETPAGDRGYDRRDLEHLFTTLRERWYPPSPHVETSFSTHGEALAAVFQDIRENDLLRFLDGQIYPEWWHLEKPGAPSQSARALEGLPPTAEETRAGFYLCNSLIQLMENVYLDLNLEEHYDHPDNRGWMNLFRHWIWSGMFRVTWAISASTYGARFQSFCRRRLDLRLGEVVCGDEEPVESPGSTRLNPVELELVGKIVKECFQEQEEFLSVVPLRLQVKNPLNETDQTLLDFPFGFGLILESDGNGERQLLYYRVQDHVRNTGLGREGLKVLYKGGKFAELVQPKPDCSVISGTDYEALERLWTSVDRTL